jgi:hypothetical protein
MPSVSEWIRACRFCRFFQEGRCHRYPPVLSSIQVSEAEEPYINVRVGYNYPPVDSDGGCGEFLSAIDRLPFPDVHVAVSPEAIDATLGSVEPKSRL